MIYLIVIPLCVLMVVALYYGLTSAGLLGGQSNEPYRSPPRSTSTGSFPSAGRGRDLPQGCLIALIVAAAAWFIAWGVILVLALDLLRSPA
ncbi:MAG: hypothetical protein M3N37_06895 [Actinomycetota bacterium]|nr:hypothetical protein [Actinomycetota bacterium]